MTAAAGRGRRMQVKLHEMVNQASSGHLASVRYVSSIHGEISVYVGGGQSDKR